MSTSHLLANLLILLSFISYCNSVNVEGETAIDSFFDEDKAENWMVIAGEVNDEFAADWDETAKWDEITQNIQTQKNHHLTRKCLDVLGHNQCLCRYQKLQDKTYNCQQVQPSETVNEAEQQQQIVEAAHSQQQQQIDDIEQQIESQQEEEQQPRFNFDSLSARFQNHPLFGKLFRSKQQQRNQQNEEEIEDEQDVEDEEEQNINLKEAVLEKEIAAAAQIEADGDELNEEAVAELAEEVEVLNKEEVALEEAEQRTLNEERQNLVDMAVEDDIEDDDDDEYQQNVAQQQNMNVAAANMENEDIDSLNEKVGEESNIIEEEEEIINDQKELIQDLKGENQRKEAMIEYLEQNKQQNAAKEIDDDDELNLDDLEEDSNNELMAESDDKFLSSESDNQFEAVPDFPAFHEGNVRQKESEFVAANDFGAEQELDNFEAMNEDEFAVNGADIDEEFGGEKEGEFGDASDIVNAAENEAYFDNEEASKSLANEEYGELYNVDGDISEEEEQRDVDQEEEQLIDNEKAMELEAENREEAEIDLEHEEQDEMIKDTVSGLETYGSAVAALFGVCILIVAKKTRCFFLMKKKKESDSGYVPYAEQCDDDQRRLDFKHIDDEVDDDDRNLDEQGAYHRNERVIQVDDDNDDQSDDEDAALRH